MARGPGSAARGWTLWKAWHVDEATWAALTATLTALGLLWTWVAFRRRGAANGLRALGFALLPAAAWLTGTLEMFVEIGGSVTDWATGLALNPLTWSGVALSGLSVVLWVVSGWMRDRAIGRGQAASPGELPSRRTSSQEPASQKPRDPVDDELADIEALLRKRGIS